MRVISGRFKGHPLKAVPGKNTRPTTDKVKEAIFQMIGPYFEGGMALDLFAGSGGLGIEGISRGIEKVIFIDKHPIAIQTIYENIKMLHIEDHTEVYRTDFFRALKAAAKRKLAFNFVFLDPPYKKISIKQIFESLVELNLLNEGCIIVVEHSTEQDVPTSFMDLNQYKSVNYGNAIQVSFYRYR